MLLVPTVQHFYSRPFFNDNLDNPKAKKEIQKEIQNIPLNLPGDVLTGHDEC